MAIYVMAIERGGYSASGGAWYDPRESVVRLPVYDPDDAAAVTVEYAETPTDVAYEESGISSSTPSISGNTVVILFQALNPGGLYKLTTSFSSGASRTLWFQAHDQQPTTDGTVTADIDYGDWTA